MGIDLISHNAIIHTRCIVNSDIIFCGTEFYIQCQRKITVPTILEWNTCTHPPQPPHTFLFGLLKAMTKATEALEVEGISPTRPCLNSRIEAAS